MKKVRHIINAIVWTLAGLYVILVFMGNIPMIQTFFGDKIGEAVSRKLGTEVHIGKVSIGFFNRIIIDDVSILDQQGKHLLRSTRMSAKLSYSDLAQGRITVTSAQLFGLDANLYQANKDAKPNFQFVIDSLQSKDTTTHKPFNIAINSLIVRHGRVAWNRLDMPRKQSFDVNHIFIDNISSHIIANAIGSDSLDINVKTLSMNEASGINLKSLTFKAAANKKTFAVKDFNLKMPNSEINIPSFAGSKTKYHAELDESHIMLSDLAPFVAKFKTIKRRIILKSSLTGNDKSLYINNIILKVPSLGNKFSSQSPLDAYLSANGRMNFSRPSLLWNVNIKKLSLNADCIKLFADNLPDIVNRIRRLQFSGTVGGYGKSLSLDGNLLSDAGNAKLNLHKFGDDIDGHLQTEAFNLGQILDDQRFGLMAADLSGNGNIKSKKVAAKGNIVRFDFNKYPYHNIKLDASYSNGSINGNLNVADPNMNVEASGFARLLSNNKSVKLEANVKNVSPAALNLAKGRLANASYSGTIAANFTGSSINDASGFLSIGSFSMKGPDIEYSLDSLSLRAGGSAKGHFVGIRSDFCNAIVYGKFNYANLPQVIQNVIVQKLPSISNLVPFKYHPVSDNFSIKASIRRSDWAKALLNIPLELRDTLHLSASVTDNGKIFDATVTAPDVLYSDYHFKNINTTVKTIDDKLYADISLTNQRNVFVGTDLNISATAGNNQLKATLAVDNHARKDRLRGSVSSFIAFHKDSENKTLAELNVQKSQFYIGDTLYNIHPSTVVYSKKHLAVNSFAISSGNQSLLLDGVASQSSSDSLTAVLHNINVEYMLNLVNFHSVDFSGAASGTACVSQLFGTPTAKAQIRVDDFRFEEGRLGTLNANVVWNQQESQIDIDAVANDTIGGKHPGPRYTFVNGYVSPKRNYIDLAIGLKDTRAELLEGFCSSFMSNPNISGSGKLRVWGDLSKINLTGEVTANGSAKITPLGVTYKLPHAVVEFTENEIQFKQDTIYDNNGNMGIVNGSIRHRHLGHMTYNIDVSARNLLAFNFDGSDGSNFYGKAFGSGTASIKGRSGEVEVDVNMRPEAGSEIVYDITSAENVGSQDFIQWVSRDSTLNIMNDSLADNHNQHCPTRNSRANKIPTDIRLNFLIDAHPDATLRLITDKTTGDYITLNGSGTLHANYFNKGGMGIFGTYTIDHGIYKLTIQNIIKRIFEFTQGGTIAFGGDPYNAALNLKAQYPIASVSLSDLQMGRSFSSNNIRVNCLMDITGTPSAPKVNFNLDFPTLSADQQQMISSVINGEEEMNQQVLYLLAVGRFYSRGANNAEQQGANQTSLAMQSILSGELSQQINNVLSSVVKNNDWNFGANISTGDEGWNNAEYEGLLSGRLLNNRLLINGQFGYRDNANATQSFIGDFDVRYLIVPNGNFSVSVYNKTNDRYFTRNTLNTQGIGFILKKDFSSLRDLLSWGKKTTKNRRQRKQQ